TGKVAEVVSRQWDVGVQGFTHGLAVVPGFGDGEFFQVGFDAVGDLQQDQRALLHGSLAPGIGGGMGGVQGLVDILGARAREFSDDFAVDRRGVDEILTLHRSDEFATDVVAVARLEGNYGACGTGLGVDHERPLSFTCWSLTGKWSGHGAMLGSLCLPPECTLGPDAVLIW